VAGVEKLLHKFLASSGEGSSCARSELIFLIQANLV
jgi:hypothetical protein